MLSDENDNFIRDYEVMYDMTLLQLHDFICSDLGYDKTEIASFYLSDRYWEKLQEYTLFDLGPGEGPIAMERVKLGQIIQKKNERLILLFDMLNERSLYLELTASAKASEGVEYPLVVLSRGSAPNQYAPADSAETGGSIFDDAMDEFGGFEGDELYDDE